MNVLDHVCEELDFFLNRYRTIIVKQAAKDVANFDDSTEFTDVFLQTSIQNFVEKLFVVVQLEGKGELVLEGLPDFVILAVGLVGSETHFFYELLVKLLCILRVVTEGVDVNVAIFFEVGVSAHFEVVVSLRIIHFGIVSQFKEELGAHRASHV